MHTLVQTLMASAAIRPAVLSPRSMTRCDADGATALHWAAERGRTDVVVALLTHAGHQRQLIPEQPQLSEQPRGTRRPQRRQPSVGSSANPRDGGDKSPGVPHCSPLPLHHNTRPPSGTLLLQSWAAADATTWQWLARMHSQGQSCALRADGSTPLHWAAREGHATTAKALAEYGAVLDLKDAGKCTTWRTARRGTTRYQLQCRTTRPASYYSIL